MRYMLDLWTSKFILKKKPLYLKKKFQNLKPGNLLISNIYLSELFYGVFSSSNIRKNLHTLQTFILGLSIVDFDFEAALEYGKIKRELKKSNITMSTFNMQTAAHSRSLKSTLITENLYEFKNVANLKVENWIE